MKQKRTYKAVAARSGKFEATEVNSMLELAFDEIGRAVEDPTA